jgi:hypothetical protein
MSALVGRLAVSPWGHAVLLSALALAVWLRHGLAAAPILWDKAYFTYLGQALLRGEPIYATTFMGYPPLGPLLSAGSMWIGGAFGLPTYLAPRCLALVLAAACVGLVYLVARRALGSAFAGGVASVTLAGFQYLADSATSTLEPKLLVVFFSLLVFASLQRRHWLATGVGSALAASCWQPAALIPAVSLAVALWGGRRSPGKTLGAYASGFLLGILPAAIYLTATNTWWEFWQRAVMIPAQATAAGGAATSLGWLLSIAYEFPGERAFFVAGMAGFLGFALGSLRSASRGLAEVWLDPRLAGVPVFTLGWLGLNSVDFDHAPDMLPLLPLVAFWVAWLSRGVVELVSNGAAPAPSSRWLRTGLWGFVLGLAAVYSFADVPPRPAFALADQKKLVASVVGLAGDRGGVVSFSAEAVYVLAELPAPNPFLRLTDVFALSLHLVEPRGCEGVLERTVQQRPGVVVVNLWQRSSECERSVGRRLLQNGYLSRKVRFRSGALGVWDVYWPGS